jgi:ABC-type Fe3+/spermidine/putrescine transport system ATPase subunit
MDVGAKALVFLRYEKIGISPDQPGGAFSGTVTDKNYLGPAIRITIRLNDGLQMVSEVASTNFTNALNVGERASMQWAPDSAVIIRC